MDESTASRVLELISEQEKVGFSMVELVYVSEEEIIRINREHLQRDYITDIITFRYDEDEELGVIDNSAIEGTLFCCAPRIIEQGQEYQESPEREFQRILIHGLLHLTGYEDQTEEQKDEMTRLENFYLDKLTSNL